MRIATSQKSIQSKAMHYIISTKKYLCGKNLPSVARVELNEIFISVVVVEDDVVVSNKVSISDYIFRRIKEIRNLLYL